MLIIIDKKIGIAGPKLVHEGEILSGETCSLLEFETSDMVYPAISGHPDIFFCSFSQVLIVAPNVPSGYSDILTEKGIPWKQGLLPVGEGSKSSSFVHYNVAIGKRHLVHRLEYTDPVILESNAHLKKIAVKQGYSRCNLLFLKEDHYITSDRGIDKALRRNGLEGLYVSPEGIILPGFTNGFIGGTMGILKNHIFLLGNLNHFPCGEQVRSYLETLQYKVIELFDGPLFDGGSILFIPETKS